MFAVKGPQFGSKGHNALCYFYDLIGGRGAVKVTWNEDFKAQIKREGKRQKHFVKNYSENL